MKIEAVLLTALLAASAGCATAPHGDAGASARTQACVVAGEGDIAALFERWNLSLQSGDPSLVAGSVSV